MIKFKKIKWKNFLSTGNSFVEYDFSGAHTTLITGNNGSGKSTLLDALVFSLFGQPYRKIKKSHIINSVNKKNLEVEIEFSIGNNEYKIHRGMGPTIFDIYVGGVRLECEGSINNQQKMLESKILNLNRKSFCQIVILGNSGFVPFMQQAADAKRLVIEDILELKIFSDMKEALKGNIRDNNNIITNFSIQLDSKKGSYNSLSKLNKNSLENIKKKDLSKNKNNRDNIIEEIKELKDKLKKLNNIIEKYPDVKLNIKDIDNKHSKLYYKTKDVREKINFLEHNDNCPTCQQKINEDHKSFKLEELEEIFNKCKKGKIKLDIKLEELNEKQEKRDKLLGKKLVIENDIRTKNSNLTYINDKISSLVEDIKSIDSDKKDLKKEKDILQNDIDRFTRDLKKREDRKKILEVCGTLLKDEYVKSKVIEYYLPIINGKINQILQDIGLYITFNFDGDFNETIQSRCVDEFNYSSFSEGEKARIDIAILLTFNHLAKIKNSINTNILILDEIFDSSLDREGSSNLNILLKQYDKDTKITVISHVENLEDKFDRNINVEKINNFTVYNENKI